MNPQIIMWSIVSALHALAMAAALTTVFPSLVSRFPPSGVFAFFCGMMVLQLLWVLAMVPETKGVPLEEIAARLAGRHGSHRGT